jgi:hypothetical protein
VLRVGDMFIPAVTALLLPLAGLDGLDGLEGPSQGRCGCAWLAAGWLLAAGCRLGRCGSRGPCVGLHRQRPSVHEHHDPSSVAVSQRRSVAAPRHSSRLPGHRRTAAPPQAVRGNRSGASQAPCVGVLGRRRTATALKPTRSQGRRAGGLPRRERFASKQAATGHERLLAAAQTQQASGRATTASTDGCSAGRGGPLTGAFLPSAARQTSRAAWRGTFWLLHAASPTATPGVTTQRCASCTHVYTAHEHPTRAPVTSRAACVSSRSASGESRVAAVPLTPWAVEMARGGETGARPRDHQRAFCAALVHRGLSHTGREHFRALPHEEHFVMLPRADMVPSRPGQVQSSCVRHGRGSPNPPWAFSMQTSLAVEKAVERCLASSVCCSAACGLS